MKLFCNGMDFDDAVSKVIKALPIKKTRPILDGIKLCARGDILTISATDIDFSIIKNIKADIKMDGEVLVPGKILSEIAKKLNNENTIELSDISDDNLTIKYMDSSMFLKLMDISEYPQITDNTYDMAITLKQKDFREIINKTNFSAANDGARPILKGCLLETNKNILTCVALDGYRLAVCNKELKEECAPIKITVPAKALLEIAKLLEEDEKELVINVCKSKIMIDLGHTKIISSLLSGDFIKYESTIPNSFETVITVNKKQLEEGIDRASIMSRYEKRNLVKLEVKEGKLTIFSNSEIGESKEVISIFTKGKDVNIGFNAKYITDCLKAINDEFIKIKINNYKYPAVIIPVETNEYLYLILPISVPGNV